MAFILLKALCARSLLYPFSMISYIISSVSSYLFGISLNSPVLANNLEILGTANVLKTQIQVNAQYHMENNDMQLDKLFAHDP